MISITLPFVAAIDYAQQNDASLFALFESRSLDQLPIILAYGFGIGKAKHWILSTLCSTVTHKDVVLFFAGRKS
jgi:hypothetical protein